MPLRYALDAPDEPVGRDGDAVAVTTESVTGAANPNGKSVAVRTYTLGRR